MESGVLVGLGVLATVVIDGESGVRFCVFVRGFVGCLIMQLPPYYTALCDGVV